MLATAVALVAAPTATAGSELGDAIKATFLYKFAPFVTWHPGALGAPPEPFVICIAGNSAFFTLIRDATADLQIGERPFMIRQVRQTADTGGCQILYAEPSENISVAALLGAVRGKPVLTVTDESQGVAARGVVNFVIYQNRVRFEIDLDRATEQQLNVSSRLLKLALRVRGSPR